MSCSTIISAARAPIGPRSCASSALRATGGGRQVPGRAGAPSRPRSARRLPLSRYAGDYVDPWYGPISIRAADGRLTIDFPHSKGMNGTLDHWQYDTFKTSFVDKQIEPAFVTFAIGADGKVERITHEGGLADRRLQLRLSGPRLHPGGGREPLNATEHGASG